MTPGEGPTGSSGHGNGPDPYQPHHSPGAAHNPYQQPGYHERNPYLQQPPPQGRGSSRTPLVLLLAGVTIAALVLVVWLIAAGGDGEGDTAARDRPSESPEEPAESGGDERAPDDPRQGIAEEVSPVVADDWQVVVSSRRKVAFDVPPDWTVKPEGTFRAWEDERPPDERNDTGFAYTLRDTAVYMENECGREGEDTRAVTGTRGAQGATDTADAAENTADNLVWAAYDQNKEGEFAFGDAVPFENEHGVSGHMVVTTVTGAPVDESEECGSSEGVGLAVAFLNSSHDMAVWGLVADTGHPDELTRETIDEIAGSLRPFGEP